MYSDYVLITIICKWEYNITWTLLITLIKNVVIILKLSYNTYKSVFRSITKNGTN